MSNAKKQNAASVSAAARIKKRNMLKRQRIAAIFAAAAALLLIAALCVVLYLADIYNFEDVNGDRYIVKRTDGGYALFYENGELCDTTDFQNKKCYLTRLGTIVSVNSESGETEIKVVVDTSGSEIQDFGTTVMMFKEMTYDKNAVKDKSMIIESIEVWNDQTSYAFIRDENGSFAIKGSEGTPFSATSFAQLANICGRTRATRRLSSPVRLESGEIDYREYGLAAETRVRTETDSNGNEYEAEYEYSPIKYIITAMNGDRHEVLVGDKTVTGTGYYAKYNGGEIFDGEKSSPSPARDTVYVLSITEDTIYGGPNGYELLNGAIEKFVTPTIVHPMSMTDYFNVSNFVIRDRIDYDRIYKELSEKFTSDQAGSSDFLETYEDLFDTYSHRVCDFTFYDMAERSGSMDAYIPYDNNLTYSNGYYLNSANVDLMLGGFYDTDFVDVIRLSPSDDELERYGLANAPYVVSFFFKTEDEKGETVFDENFVDISEKSEDGLYYAYSPKYDMIVSVNAESFEFLEWDETYWYSESYMQFSISHVDSILIESPAFSTRFDIEDSASKYLGYVARSGEKFKVGDKEYLIEKDENGRYILTQNGERIEPLYSGDHLITPVVYTYGERQAENYLFSESSEADINGDGNNDGVIYYFYDIVRKDGKYSLVAQVVLTDYDGNAVSDTKVVWGEVAYESSCFMTKNGYLFFADKESSVGKNIEATYGRYSRGEWFEGRMFITSSGQNIIVDEANGAWLLVDDVSCGLYLADKERSRLSERAVLMPAKYDESGKLKRYSETYYPLTDKLIAYDEEKDMIVSYDKVRKEWKKITYSDCTIGVWGVGDYYVLEGGVSILVDSATGDFGDVAVLSTPIYLADIYSDGKLLDYTIEKEGYSASSQSATAMKNFQELYKYLLTASFEDIAEIDDALKEEFKKNDDFTSGADEACVLKITIKASDLKGNEREVVYRFYRYSERRAYITIEMPDESGSSSEKAYGNFSVLYSFVRKVIEDAQKVIDAEPVYSTEKY